MSIEGSINVSALFHDRDGTTAMKVVSLRSASEYTTGKVAIITGTAGTAAVTLSEYGETPYRDASGAIVNFDLVTRVAFQWSGSSQRVCEFTTYDGGAVALASASGSVATSETDRAAVQPSISTGVGTGTYTIVLYGT